MQVLVAEIMNRPVLTCGASDTLTAAAGLMWENDCGALPVVDAEGVVIGMITDRDICMSAYTTGRALSSIAVETAMAKRVTSCLPSDDIVLAEAAMARAQVRRLPVVDGQGRVIGILTMNDIARACANAGKRTASAVTTTLAAICAPRARELVKAA